MPEGVFAVMSDRNDNPGRYNSATAATRWQLTDVTRNGKTFVFKGEPHHSFNMSTYLGVIVDSERNVLWENKTMPLPNNA